VGKKKAFPSLTLGTKGLAFRGSTPVGAKKRAQLWKNTLPAAFGSNSRIGSQHRRLSLPRKAPYLFPFTALCDSAHYYSLKMRKSQ
jgi:hypothetical protein